MIFPGSLTALRYELQASASASWNRNLGTFFESTLAGLLSRPRWPKRPSTILLWSPFRWRVSSPLIFCSTISAGSRFWNFARILKWEWEVEGKMGRVGLCFRSFGRFRSGISESTVELRSMKFFFLSISEFSSWAFVIWRG